MKRYFYLLTALFLSLIIYSCDEENNDIPENQSIQGLLLDSQGLGIPNTVIDVIKKDLESSSKRSNPGLTNDEIIASDTTDEDGNFSFDNIPNELENLVVHINHPDFELIDHNLEDFVPENNDGTWQVMVPRREECTYELSVSVYEGHTGPDSTTTDVINEAVIKIWQDGDLNRKSYSDVNGVFNFEEMCPGEYEISVEKEGYEDYEDDFVIDENNNVVDIIAYLDAMSDDEDSIVCCDASLELIVVSKGNSTAISNARVEVNGPDEYFEDGATDDNGTSSFSELCDAEYEITVSAEGYKTEKTMLEFECEEEKIYTIELAMEDEEECCDNVIHVEAIDLNGDVIEEGIAYLGKGSNVQDSIQISGQAVSFTNICEGEWRVKVEGPGYEPRDKEFKVECGDTLTWTVEMKDGEGENCCDNSIIISPTDTDGNPIESGVAVLRIKEESITKELNGGSIAFGEICSGEVSVIIEAQGYKTTDKEFNLTCKDTVEWKPQLMGQGEEPCCDGVLKLIVTDSVGDWVENAKVIVYQDGKAIADPRTKGDTLVIEDLCEGEIEVVIEKEGYEKVELEFEIDCDNENVETVVLEEDKECCTGELIVNPKDKETGELIEGALIKLYYGDELVGEGEVGADEGAVFDSLCEGKHIIVIQHEDYGEYEVAVEIDCDEEKVFTESFNKKDECCDGKIAITIVDENGEAIERGKVKLWKGGEPYETYTFENGEIVIENLCEGVYGVDIQSEGYGTIEFEIEIDCDEELEISRTLESDECCDNVVKFIIKDEEGNLVDTSYVKIYKGEKELYDGIAADGEFIQDKLCEGDDYWIKIEIDDEVVKEYEFIVECDDDTQEVAITVDDPCCDNVVKIIIKDENGDLVDSLEIVIYKGEKALYEGTAWGGEFTQDKLCEGNDYWAKIRTKGGEVIKQIEFDVDCDDNEQEVNVTVEKECCDNIMNLHFKDEDGNYVDSLEVELYDGERKIYEGYVKDGVFTQDKLCDKAYWGKVYKNGEKIRDFEFNVECDDNEQDHTITIEDECCDNVMEFFFKDKNGDLIDSVYVDLYKGETKLFEVFGENGSFKQDKLCEGVHWGKVYKHGQLIREFEFDVDCDDNDQEQSVTIDFCCTASLKFIVKDNDNDEAIEGAEVEVLLGSKVVAEGETDANGEFTTDDDLCNFEYKIKIKKSGYNDITTEWNIEECDEHQETFKMKK